MQTSFITVLKYNLSGQLIARVISFGVNIYLLRHVDASILGLVNVRMMLLYTTIGFLSREPLRKACLTSDLTVPDCVKYAWLSPLLYTAITAFFTTIWWTFPPTEHLNTNGYGMLLASFSLSALVEGLAEPLAILSLKTAENGHFAIANAVLNFLQRVIVLALLLAGSDAITAFCVAQVLSSVVYALIHFRKFFTRPDTRALVWPSGANRSGYDMRHMRLIGTLLGHSILKQLITDGAGYVMTFTRILTLEKQAVFDAVDRLGSLVARTILAPLEESAAVYFASHLRRSREHTEVPKKVLVTFTGLLRVIVVLGLVICVFGIPYSNIAVQLYGGDLLVNNQGGPMLTLYAVYLAIMAVNGITECFAFASMDTRAIFSHGAFLLVTSVIHLLLNLTLSSLFGAAGFIIANWINSASRIVYSWIHIRRRLKSEHLSFTQFLPSFTLCIMLFFALFATSMSSLIFASAGGILHNLAHIAVGGIMFLLVLAYLYQSEDLFTSVLEKID